MKLPRTSAENGLRTVFAVTFLAFKRVAARMGRKVIERERGMPGFRGKIAKLLLRIVRKLCA